MMNASMLTIALIAGLMLGLIPGLIAKRKGRCFLCAYLIGALVFAAIAFFGARYLFKF